MASVQTRSLEGETEEQVRARRGSPDDTLTRIRAHYNLDCASVSDAHIFYLACKYYYTDEHARNRAPLDYDRFVKSGRTILPDYVYRCGDPDVEYPPMHK